MGHFIDKPGLEESIKFLIILKYRDIPDDFIVIPRSCSSSRESRYLTLPASFELMIPLDAKSESESVVFPENNQFVKRSSHMII